MPLVSVSEALAEFPVLDTWIARKRRFIESHLIRSAALRDPFAKEGGTPAVLARESASVFALEQRKLLLRRLIQIANERTEITFEGTSRSVADWLVFKREVFTERQRHLNRMQGLIASRRTAGREVKKLVVHYDEAALSEELENLTAFQTWLAGQLNLRNATMTVDVPEADWRTGMEDRLDQLGGSVEAAASIAGRELVYQGLADPTKKIHLIKVLRELTGKGLAETKTLAENPPRILGLSEGVNLDAAAKQLQEAGALVSIR